jgi:pimeloyl-ACP methyl ester carboxylesterase
MCGKLLLLLFWMFSLASIAQEKMDLGPLKGGTYQVLIPKNWNKKLVMFAHGYQFMGSPGASANAGLAKKMQFILDRGFALAASDYPIQGWALPEAVDATEELRKKFIEKYGQPDSTFMVGQSMGGGITLAIMENFGEFYHGALPMCPLASRPYLQNRKEFDMYATFNGLFPGIVPSLKEIFDPKSSIQFVSFQQAGSRMQEISKAVMLNDSVLAKAFAKRFDLKLKDLPSALFFNLNVLRDIALKAQGNPFDNTQTIYTGFPDDEKVNAVAERLEATKNPDLLYAKYDRTGKINKPVLLLHTIYDQLIPPTYAVTNFENMVIQQNKHAHFAVKYTDGQGHCAFTPQQSEKAFDALRKWVYSGVKPISIEKISN